MRSDQVLQTLRGKVVVITGATGGLGSAIAKIFALHGANVVVGFNRSIAKANALVATLSGSGHIALAIPVTDSSRLELARDRVLAQYGRCDILVNCAGTTTFVAHGDLNGMNDALIDEIFTTNVRGAIACVRVFQQMLAATGEGLIVNISSVAAQTGIGSNIAYCASKAALDNLTKSLARALAPQIRVLSVAPGLVDTEFVQGLSQKWREEQVLRTPLGRLATVDEIAGTVLATAVYLTFTTGAVISVDGGRPL
ncbi:SDR family NAD(P)-dependent oxidoreductase [Glaciimonas sp. PCH181]|uniref:SDR family NAD(P)-dependent oxidoreductase n=1 Tax=Glaciimonas sp. PCH181 TaxID=2133943 RepID=UPI000D3652D8|nr:SDR family oxidoreductase [Glaciimonas sp. PCH181]PUA19514.1 short-chain dehydrogenase [Glaciimonas sp. PCH181]